MIGTAGSCVTHCSTQSGGSLAPWFSAAGSVVASIVAVSIAVVAARRETRREKDAEAQGRSQVLAFYWARDSTAWIVVVNGSQLTISDIVLTVRSKIAVPAGLPPVVWQWSEANVSWGIQERYLLPGREHRFAGVWTTKTVANLDGFPTPAEPRTVAVDVLWTDATGTWKRTDNGKPQEATYEPPRFPPGLGEASQTDVQT